MAQDYTAKKVLLKNTAGDYLIPYTEPIKWGEITGTLSNQTDLNEKFTSITSDMSDFVIMSIRPLFAVQDSEEAGDYEFLEVLTDE